MAEQIKIGADVSGVLGAVQKIKEATDGLNKSLDGVDVNIRTDSAQKSLSSLTATAEAARKALAAAGGAFDLDLADQSQALDELKAALDEIAKLAAGGVGLKVDTAQARAEIEKLRQALAGKLATDAKSGGGDGALNQERRRALREEREERNRLRRIGGAGQQAPGAGAPGSPTTPGGDGKPGKPGKADEEPKSFFRRLGEQMRADPQTGRLGRITGMAGGIAGGLMSGNGSGGMMRSVGSGLGTLGGAAIGTLIGGPLGAVVGGLAGSLLGSIGGGAGGKVDEAIGDVIAEGLDLSNLQRSVGGTNTSFGELQHRLREASAGLQTTFGEMAKYGQAFARQANFRGEASELAEEVKNAVGYARGFGADPQAGLQFAATMRHTQASKSDQDSRKIGLSVAEAIGRGGLGPKTDEVLTAIGNFANQATNQALTAADVSSFAGALGAASATGIAGLSGNPANAAAIIGQADAAMRQGGSYGQASSVLTDIALRKRGMNFGDVNLLKEQGLFGTERSAFGADSAVQKSLRAKLADTSGNISEAEKASMRAELARLDGLAASGDGRTNADKVMGQMRSMASNETEYREGLKNHFGLKSAAQAEAFDTIMRTSGGTGALQKRLEQAGVDTKNLSALSIGGMSEAYAADRSGLQRMGNDILKDQEFSSKNRDLADKLRAAMAGKDTEALRDALFLAKEKGAGNMTDIERANQASIDLKNEFMKYADKILPLVTSAKDGILALVQKMAPDTRFGKQLAQEERIRELAASDDPQDRKRAEEMAARMTAQGKRPATEEAAKAAAAGAGEKYDRLDARARKYEDEAKDIRENGWFFTESRASRAEERAKRYRDAQANLKGGTRADDAPDIPAPEGAATAAKVTDAAPKPSEGAATAVKVTDAAPKPSRKEQANWDAASPHLVGASQRAGVDPGVVAKIARFESGFNADAQPRRRDGTLISSAHGYGQFIDGTWADVLNQHGAKYGIAGAGKLTQAQAAQYRSDKGIQAAMLAEHTRDNIAKGRRLGGADDDANVYAFHNLGDGDATRLLSGLKRDPNMKVRDALLREGASDKERARVERVISGNKSLYGDGNTSVADAYGRMGKVMREGEYFAAQARAAAAPPRDDLTQPIPAGGKDGPGAVQAAGAPAVQPTVKVISEIRILDQHGKERSDVQARPVSYESLPAGVPA